MGNLNSYYRRLWQSRFARSVAVVAGGTAAAQIIALAFMPIITRLYGPEAFGLLGSFNAILAIMVPMAAFSYPIAIVLPEKDSDAKELASLCIKLGLTTSLIVALILTLTGPSILLPLNISDASKFILFVPVAMLFSVLFATANQWAVRKKLFKLQAKVAVANALFQNLLNSGVGYFSPFAWILVAVLTFSKGLSAGLLYMGFKKESTCPQDEKQPTECERLSQIALAKRHSDFALFRTPQIILNAASQSLPVLMLTGLFGPAVAGFYALGKMALAAPTQLLGLSVGTVFYPHFNETVLKGQSGAPLLLKATMSLAAAGFVPFAAVILFGSSLFKLVFGADWEVAGEFASWMAVWTFVSFIARPSVAAIPVLNLQHYFLIHEIISILLRVASLYTGFLVFGTALSAVIAYSLINAFLYALLILFTYIKASKSTCESVGIS